MTSAPTVNRGKLARELAGAGLAKRLAGVDTRRTVPTFAARTFRSWFAEHQARTDAAPVLLWPDTELTNLLPNDLDARRLAQQSLSLAELLTRASYRPFRLERWALLQRHCHQGAVIGAAAQHTIVLADGFSCRGQIEQGTDRQALHLAEVLALARRRGPNDHRSERPRGTAGPHRRAPTGCSPR